jgi:hypothetical protein
MGGGEDNAFGLEAVVRSEAFHLIPNRSTETQRQSKQVAGNKDDWRTRERPQEKCPCEKVVPNAA